MNSIQPRSAFSKHMPALDGVRGLAIGMVLLVHFLGEWPASNTVERIVFQAASYGAMGVDLFFVLSGFLITGILFDAKGDPNYFKNFYMRRLLRIFPLYYGVLAVLFFAVRWLPWCSGPDMDEMVQHQSWAWLYAINIYIAKMGTWSLSYISHFWSLAVEEHFYLFWPLVVWFFKRETLLKVCLGFVALSLLLRVGLYFEHVNALAIYTLTPCRFDALCIGGFLAVAVRGKGTDHEGMTWLHRAGFRLLVPSAIVIILSFGLNHFIHEGPVYQVLRPIREMLFAFCFAAVVAFAVSSRKETLLSQIFTSSLMTFLGKYSYGLYVFHAMFSYAFHKPGTLEQVQQYIPNTLLAITVLAVVGIGFSILAALASFHWFEKRFLGLKVKFEHGNSGGK